MIPLDLENWLTDAGYEHYVFISYPDVPDAEVRRCALTVARALRQALADYTSKTSCHRAFVATDCISNGAAWEPALQRALCRSVMMVALCAPIYYHPEHPWCGREYQAMLSLGTLRKVNALVPIIVREVPHYPLPDAVTRLESIRLVDAVKMRRDPLRDRRFIEAIDEIMRRMRDVADALRANNVPADSFRDEFRFPEESAFKNYGAAAQPAPLRSAR